MVTAEGGLIKFFKSVISHKGVNLFTTQIYSYICIYILSVYLLGNKLQAEFSTISTTLFISVANASNCSVGVVGSQKVMGLHLKNQKAK